MVWQLVQNGHVICQHALKRICVIEDLERGLVQRSSRRDFVADEPMPNLMFAPNLSNDHRPVYPNEYLVETSQEVLMRGRTLK